MRSLPIFVTAATVALVSAHETESDVIVTVTSTRTQTICPLTTAFTCESTSAAWDGGDAGQAWASVWDSAKYEYSGVWNDWSVTETFTSTTTEGGEGGNSGHPTTVPSSTVPFTSIWTSSPSVPVSPESTQTLSASTYASYTHSSTFGNSSSFSSSLSTSSVSVISTSKATTSSTTSTASTLSTTTTSASLCPASASAVPVVNSTDICNTAADRSRWCNGKSISTDYYSSYSTGNTVYFDLTITNTTKNPDGTGPKIAFAVNGQIPGPVIEANWGDLVVITVTNMLQDNSTSIHWHGIRQLGTNDQDGVPGVTECAIAGNGGSRTYTWRASSYGTSWYHSHAGAQYGDGIRGPIVIHGPATANYDYDMGTLMLDDTFAGNTAATQASFVSHTGGQGTFNTLFNGMNINPVAPVGGQPFQWTVKSCKKHLFRIINSASQNSYIVSFDSHTMTVIAADFVPIVPYTTTTLKIANGQRYDVIVKMDQAPSKYFVRAVIQGACPSGGANSGLGTANAIMTYEGVSASVICSSTTTITTVSANICQDEPLASLVPYLPISAGSSSAFSASVETLATGAVSTLKTSDDGTVYQWFINNVAINVNYSQPTLESLAQSGATSSLISAPLVLDTAGSSTLVYFIIQNQFFVSHPMHIHGHDVFILGTGGVPYTSSAVLNFDNPMRRDTIMLQGSSGVGVPSGYTVIGFYTDNPGAWLMHCHIVWHLDEGLALQFIERPDDINAAGYVSKPSYQQECSALAAYESLNPASEKLSPQSGLKRRTVFESLESNSRRKRNTKRTKKHRSKRYAPHGHSH